MPSEEWQEILRLTSEQQLLPIQGFNAPSSGSPLQQTVNISDPFPMYFQTNTPKVAQSAQTEVNSQ